MQMRIYRKLILELFIHKILTINTNIVMFDTKMNLIVTQKN